MMFKAGRWNCRAIRRIALTGILDVPNLELKRATSSVSDPTDPSRTGANMAKNHGQDDNGKSKLKRKEYEKELRRLQAELCHLQAWVKHKGLRVMVIFEGRDGAGKGGTIKAITERVSPRVFHLVALPAPSDREQTQMYMQRYMAHFPAAGEVTIFDRSWYNRAGVEYVMGFCDKQQHRRFLDMCPEVEHYIVESGIQLIKFWL